MKFERLTQSYAKSALILIMKHTVIRDLMYISLHIIAITAHVVMRSASDTVQNAVSFDLSAVFSFF